MSYLRTAIRSRSRSCGLLVSQSYSFPLPKHATKLPLYACKCSSAPEFEAAGQWVQRRMNSSYKQTILSGEILRSSSVSTLQHKPTSEERHQLVAARKFFERGYSFLYSAESLRHHAMNDHLPEVIILGASNVGKSSFINALIGQCDAARVSHRPGKTTMMNAFGIGPPPKTSPGLIRKGFAAPTHSLILMDSPGYGYKSQASWGNFIMEYLKGRGMLRGAVLLLSSEKRLLPEDKWMLRTLAESNTRTMVVLTKADKGRSQWATKCDETARCLREEMQRLEETLGNGWTQGSGWLSDVYITAANMGISTKLANGCGVGGARLAILDMAGFNSKTKVEQKDEAVAYTGSIVPFDDIQWKGSYVH